VRAVTFDLRGHGRSGPAGDGFTLDRIAADALAVADAAGLDEFVVLGFSMSASSPSTSRWSRPSASAA
jgi:pimeloyl-ACP methyl ester carboxylesterase